jgi:hypothetical protein
MGTRSTCFESLEHRTLLSTVQAVGSEFSLGGTPFSVNYPNYIGRKVVADNQGNLLAMWVDADKGTVQVQSFHADGTPRSAPFDTKVSGMTDEVENIAISGDGKSFAMVWMNNDQSSRSYYDDHAQFFAINTAVPGTGIDSEVVSKGSSFNIAAKSKLQVFVPYVAMDYAGNSVIAWTVGNGSDLSHVAGVHAQQYSKSGALIGQEINVSTLAGSHTDLSVVMNRTSGVTGNFVLAWTNTGQDNPDGSAGVYGRVFRNGSPVSAADVLLNQTTAGDQGLNSVAMGPDGGFIAAWVGPDGDSDGQYIRRFDSNASPLGNDILVNDQTTGDQFRGRVGIGPNGDCIVAWCDGTLGTGQANVYAQAISADGARIGSNFLVGTNDGLYLEVMAQPNGQFVISWGDHNQGVTWGQKYEILS